MTSLCMFFLSPLLPCIVMPLSPGSVLLRATAVRRQEWKGQRSQHLISIDQVLFQCHPRVSGVCCRCHSVRQERGTCNSWRTHKDTRQAAHGDADVRAVLQRTANVSLLLPDGNSAALVAPCHTRHKSGLGDCLRRVLLHVWTSSRGRASKTWRSLQECLLSETLFRSGTSCSRPFLWLQYVMLPM